MLTLLQIPLTLPEGERAVASMGSILHGALMERIPRDMAAELHTEAMRPYSQSIVFSRECGQAFWRIGVLEDRTAEAFLSAIPQHEELCLRQKGYGVCLGAAKVVRETSFEELTDSFMEAAQAPRGVTFSFLTPTSFKRAGRYVLFPEAQLIFQSLVMRWNSFSRTILLEDADLPERLAACCTLARYSLRSERFSLEGRQITGFCGQVSYRFGGTELARCVLGLLAAFAPFAGIGIKTALGMGAADSKNWSGRRQEERSALAADSHQKEHLS